MNPFKHMPYAPKTRGRKSTTKRTYRRKAAKPSRSRARLSGPFKNFVGADPFRNTMSAKMHYTQVHTLSSGFGGFTGAEKVINLNSLFSPDFSGGGHQPYAFDQMALLYRKYKVTAVLVECKYNDPSADGMFVAVQIQPPQSPATITGKRKEELSEQPMSVVRSINNSGNQKGVIRQFVPISTVSGLTKLQFQADVDLFTAQTTASPTAIPYLRVAVGTDRATSSTMIITLKITFYSTFYERIVLDQS